MGVTTASSVLKFTLKELEDLVKDHESQVYLKKDVKYPLKLTPACLQNVNQAITEILTAERLKYIPKYKGLLLAFKHVRRHSNMGTINDDECNILIHVHVDLYIFAPTVGCTMTGIVSKVGEDDVGCLVHKGFNVTLPRPRNDAEWIGATLQLGDHVKFRLDTFNVVGTLPYIRGTLLSRVAGVKTTWSTELVDAWGLPTSSKLEKKKKSAVKEENDLLSLSPKKVSKKKKQTEEKEMGVEVSDVVATKKTKKRKTDPITMPSFKLEQQDSNKKKAKLTSESVTEEPYKSSLRQLLDSTDDEGESSSRPAATKAKSEKMTKKSKAAAAESLEVAAPSLKAKTKPKASKSLGEILAFDSDDEDNAEIPPRPNPNRTSGEGSKPKKSSSIQQSPKKKQIAGLKADSEPPAQAGKTAKTKKKMLHEQKSDAGLEVDASSSGKKNKVKRPKKEELSTEKIGEMSIEALMQQALENVSGKTPKSKRPLALPTLPSASDAIAVQLPSEMPVQGENSKIANKKMKTKPGERSAEKSATVLKQPSLRDMLLEDSDCPNNEEELPKSPKKKKQTNASKSFEKANNLTTPSKLATVQKQPSLRDMLHEDSDSANQEEQLPKSPKKKKQMKPSGFSEVANDLTMRAKLLANSAPSSAKRKCETSLSAFKHEDLPNPAKLLPAAMQEERPKSPNKKKATKVSELMETPSNSAAGSEASSSKKKRKSSLASISNKDDATKELLAKLLKDVSTSLNKRKKAETSKPLDVKASLKMPSELLDSSESGRVKKNRKSSLSTLLLEDESSLTPAELPAKLLDKSFKSAKKNIKTKPNVPLENGETTSKLTKLHHESSASKKKSKSILLGFLNDEDLDEMPLSTGSKTPLPNLPPLPTMNEISASKGSPVKKLRKPELGTSGLLQKLLNVKSRKKKGDE